MRGRGWRDTSQRLSVDVHTFIRLPQVRDPVSRGKE